MPYIGQNVMSFDTIPAFEAYGKVRLDIDENQSLFAPQSGYDEATGRELVVFCPWGTQAMANNILTEIQGYAYQPFNADGAILDPAAQLGDGVTVNGVDSVFNAIGTRFSSLCSANISAPQDEEIDHEYPYESKENREITRSIASTKARLTVLSDSITAEVTRATAAEGTLSASIALTAESVTSEVTRATAAEGELSSRITQTADSVSSEVSRATAAEDSLSSRITQTATEVSSKVSKGSIISEINQSAEEIKISADKLTLTGLVTISALGTAGAVTINGGNITADTINANRIVANSWGGLNIGGSSSTLASMWLSETKSGIQYTAKLTGSGVDLSSPEVGTVHYPWAEIGGSAVWG